MTSSSTEDIRDCRPRRRSRFGCRNCKLRKVKCDEARPRCRKCTSFGLLCNFQPKIPDLQPLAHDAMRVLVMRDGADPRPQPPVTSAVWTSDVSTSYTYQLNGKCQDFITRYLGRSLTTPNDPSMMLVNRKLLELAFTHPYLMHASLAVAFAHDRHLRNSSDCPRSVEECFHWSQGTMLLRQRLSKPIESQDKDPIWGTAAALAILAYASPDAATPEESWPLKSSDHSDLSWLRASEAKMSLLHIVDPLRPDSLFSVMAATFAYMYAPLPERGILGIPHALAAVCGLSEISIARNNPYFHPAHALAQLLSLPDTEIRTGHVHAFTRTIEGSFKDLLRKRDPVALLLLYIWYRKVSCCVWWVALRARLECPAICLYLQLYHKENMAVQAFLPGGALADGHY